MQKKNTRKAVGCQYFVPGLRAPLKIAVGLKSFLKESV
jgi:hypothetical protein